MDEEKKKLDFKFWSTLIWPEIVVDGKLMQPVPENTTMKMILPFEGLPYFSSHNCWADHRLEFGAETKVSFVLKSGPMSAEVAQTQLPLPWRKPDGERDLDQGEQGENSWGSEFQPQSVTSNLNFYTQLLL